MKLQIYAQPISCMVVEILAVPIIWSVMLRVAFQKKRLKTYMNIALLCVAVYLILYSTLLNRAADAHSNLVSLPFQLFLVAIREKHEIIRSLLLNILLFVPLGCALSNLLPQQIPVWGRILLTVCAGLLLSLSVESCQFHWSLGNAEADDVICNTLGTFMGTLSLPIKQRLNRKV